MTDVYDNYLIHWGKKGMKWGVRHDRITLGDRVRMRRLKRQSAALQKRTGLKSSYNTNTFKMYMAKGYDNHAHSNSQKTDKSYKQGRKVYDKQLSKYRSTLEKYKSSDKDLKYAAKVISAHKAFMKTYTFPEASDEDYKSFVAQRKDYREGRSTKYRPT